MSGAAPSAPILGTFDPWIYENEPWRTDPVYVDLKHSKHLADKCKPCIFTQKIVGCWNGDLCNFCHFKHKSPLRPSKFERQQIKAIAKDCLEKADPKFLEDIAKTSNYMNQVLKASIAASEVLL
jgi:hypothetical protein